VEIPKVYGDLSWLETGWKAAGNRLAKWLGKAVR
jgi:hypothetical protein